MSKYEGESHRGNYLESRLTLILHKNSKLHWLQTSWLGLPIIRIPTQIKTAKMLLHQQCFQTATFLFLYPETIVFYKWAKYSVRIYFATGTQMRKLILSDLCIYGIKHLYKLCSFCKWWLLSASEKLTHVQIAPAIFNRYSSPLKVSNSLFGCPLKTAQYCP